MRHIQLLFMFDKERLVRKKMELTGNKKKKNNENVHAMKKVFFTLDTLGGRQRIQF